MILTRDLLRRAHLVIAKNDVRYYLNYVLIEPHPTEGALLISCDGHRMLVIHDHLATNVVRSLVRVATEVLNYAGQNVPRHAPVHLSEPKPGGSTCYAELRDPADVPACVGLCELLPDASVYPKWRGVMPATIGPIAHFVMSGAYVDDAVRALKTDGVSSTVIIYAPGASDQAYLVVPGPSQSLRALMLIMPIRDDYQGWNPLAQAWLRGLIVAEPTPGLAA